MEEMTQAEMIADELRRALLGEAWHGPSLYELLEGVTADQAVQRPIAAAHNIWELVLHITSWANIALRRIAGGQVEPFGGEDWPVPGGASAEQWAAIRAELTASHERLRKVVLGLTDQRLATSAPQSSRSVAAMLHGVVQHAAYHGGQIALLKKDVSIYHRRAAL
ncbi:MAG: DinB family protein [Gemmatimonadaceae bacterium]|nr:DinB family protein [Gemmatimonadaceae bacterium]